MHAMEVSLGQGKLQSMKLVKKQLKVSYVSELEEKARVVRSQIGVKRSGATAFRPLYQRACIHLWSGVASIYRVLM